MQWVPRLRIKQALPQRGLMPVTLGPNQTSAPITIAFRHSAALAQAQAVTAASDYGRHCWPFLAIAAGSLPACQWLCHVSVARLFGRVPISSQLVTQTEQSSHEHAFLLIESLI